MKMNKAWPDEEKIDEPRVWPKNLIDKTVSETMEKSIDTLLKESFENPDDSMEDKDPVEPIVKKKIKVRNDKSLGLKIESSDKYVWISLGILFFLGFCAYNTLIYKLGIIETLISRRKSVMALK